MRETYTKEKRVRSTDAEDAKSYEHEHKGYGASMTLSSGMKSTREAWNHKSKPIPGILVVLPQGGRYARWQRRFDHH